MLKFNQFPSILADEQGIALFAFHGKINTALKSSEAGSFSQDIRSATKSRWVFTDNSTLLKPGDILYYWIYVEHNDGSGVRGYPSIIQAYKVPNQSAENPKIGKENTFKSYLILNLSIFISKQLPMNAIRHKQL